MELPIVTIFLRIKNVAGGIGFAQTLPNPVVHSKIFHLPPSIDSTLILQSGDGVHFNNSGVFLSIVWIFIMKITWIAQHCDTLRPQYPVKSISMNRLLIFNYESPAMCDCTLTSNVWHLCALIDVNDLIANMKTKIGLKNRALTKRQLNFQYFEYIRAAMI
jgi:hypothetical protein